MQISFFTTALYNVKITPFLYPYKNIEYLELFKHIKEGGFKKYLHKFYTNEIIKKQLPNFTPAGVFKCRGENGEQYLQSYSGIVHLDFDKQENLGEILNVIKDDDFTFAYFKSPSMRGAKVFIKVNSLPSQHKTAFSQVRDYYHSLTGVWSDPAPSNIANICYISHDPSLYINWKSETFKVDVNIKPVIDPIEIKFGSIEEYLIQLTENKYGTYPGDQCRNNWLFRFACNCNRFGLGRDHAYAACKAVFSMGDTYDFPEHEFRSLLKSAYSKTAEHGSFKYPRSVKH